MISVVSLFCRHPVQNIYMSKVHSLRAFFYTFKKMLMNKKVSMEIINPNAAGIDVGSRSHFVAIGQGSGDVREFGVYNEDLRAIVEWLIENDVKTVAMESTGTYWQSLFAVLQCAGLQVI